MTIGEHQLHMAASVLTVHRATENTGCTYYSNVYRVNFCRAESKPGLLSNRALLRTRVVGTIQVI